MILKDFIPPVIINAAKFLKQNQKLYSSYKTAQAQCKNGYTDKDLLEVIYQKTRIFRDAILLNRPVITENSFLRTLIGLSLALRRNELNVIDFGGACGAHYFISKMVFGKSTNLRWHVVETPNIVSSAIELEDGHLKFFDDLQKAKDGLEHIDLVFSSGALQYTPEPYEFLEQLTECKAKNIFITRAGLSTLPKELIIVQKARLSENGIGPMPQGMNDKIIQYPVIFARKDKFEEILSRNYSIEILFNEDERYYAAGQPINMYGYFGVLRKWH